MATNESIKNQLKQQEQPKQMQERPQVNSVQGLLKNPVIQGKFQQLLKEKTSGFTSSLITLVNGDSYLSDSDPMSIITGAMQAAQLDLPLEKQFGFAYLVPFNSKEGNKWVKKAQFVLGYRGYIQLAQRSGQYKSINVGNVYEGQLESWNPLTEELVFNPEGKVSDNVVGYFGYFQLLNGFEKTVYWTKEQVEKHRVENNKSKDKSKLTGVWTSNYDAMAQKTVLRNLLSKWGILSIEMQKAVLVDESEEFQEEQEQILQDVTPVETATVEANPVAIEAIETDK
ncbi:recombinase RecT [Suicoccus acidiformans]|uniref:Recombinase RecT n=1 Tax=Suicoccus acidiformans TaxID=2036206 RepID=A0A347WIM0_9LACT|nr:recombinase RecT [Suicoccus acidiformans]AXY24927.1 recombinase RecT [Suicoccus acidiformans]